VLKVQAAVKDQTYFLAKGFTQQFPRHSIVSRNHRGSMGNYGDYYSK